ncbi:pyridoxal 5'-phosphate synthase lyase subunit PdxS [Halobacteriales archaeon QS_9_70_65]|nr:MAG: pyridoxal 5'-phosphate synthase lyase subunit PdxS [Halobacteriales archaeon QS_9_70_65]
MSETDLDELRRGTELVKRGFAKMQKGGVIMDVVSREQARVAEDAGAVAVMHLESVPADIRKRGGVARMADPGALEEIIDEVSLPVMGKARIGHRAEAQILEAAGADMVDESEVLTEADERYHIDKREFTAPFVCGARNLQEALRRIDEGAAMIRTKGEAGTGDVNQAVTHQRNIQRAVRKLDGMSYEERDEWAREHEGCDGIFVGSGIFGAEDPTAMGTAVVEAVNNYDDPERLRDIAKGIGKGMTGRANDDLDEDEQLQTRGV